MSRYGLINLIDKIFITIGVFLLVFAWINFYVHSLWISFVLGIIFCFAIVYLLFYLIGRKNKKVSLSKASNEEMNKLFLHFKLNPKNERLKIIKSILEKEFEIHNKNFVKQDFDCIVEKKMSSSPSAQPEMPQNPSTKNFEKSDENLNKTSKKLKNLNKNAQILENSDKNFVNLQNGMLTYKFNGKLHLVILATNFEMIKQNDLLNLIDEFLNLDVDEIDIVCAETQNVNADIFKNKKINFVTKHDLYNLFKKHEIYPKADNIKNGADKLKFIDILKNMFVPQKAKGYFVCGLVILFSSIILPYHIYYLVFGSVLILFSLACKLMPKFSK